MIFRYEVEVTAKNNQLTRDTASEDLARLIQEGVATAIAGWSMGLPWIIQFSIKEA